MGLRVETLHTDTKRRHRWETRIIYLQEEELLTLTDPLGGGGLLKHEEGVRGNMLQTDLVSKLC